MSPHAISKFSQSKPPNRQCMLPLKAVATLRWYKSAQLVL
jgi:hypothetical protein